MTIEASDRRRAMSRPHRTPTMTAHRSALAGMIWLDVLRQNSPRDAARAQFVSAVTH
jgi:hypothetical protein